MARITLRIMDGADRGRLFQNLEPPITIGREEGNSIQLNDERVSRFHLKVQEDNDRLVLTDLESTNGTKVNGEDTQLRILRYGDMITVGRTVLLFGSREQIAGRLSQLRGAAPSPSQGTAGKDSSGQQGSSFEFELNYGTDDLQATLHCLEPPELPDRMSPGQAAQLAELLEFFHVRVRSLLRTVQSNDKLERVTLDQRQWQMLLDFQARLAEYLRRIGEPESDF
ncbi:MAG: FHA domain-containing protein [Pirellulaceae bacterium]